MEEPIVDFRRRTARLRRERTGRRLVQALFECADQAQLRTITVDDVLSRAEMARGSFYRHFPTMGALLDHVGAGVGAQINSEMSERFDAVSDPALRIALHARYQVDRASTDRVCAQLLLRLLSRDGAVSEFARDHALADFREGVEQQRLVAPSATMASDLGHGMLTAILRRAVTLGYDMDEVRAQVEIMLRAFGVAEAGQLVAVPLPSGPSEPLREAVMELCTPLSV